MNNEKQLGINKKNQEVYSKIISWLYLSLMSFTIIKRLLGSSVNATIISAIISFPILIFYILKLIIASNAKIRNKFLLPTVFLVLFLYMVSLIRGVPQDKVILYTLFSLYGICLLFIAFSIENLENLYDELNKKSYVIALISPLIIFVDKNVSAYSMRYSYLLSISLYFHTIGLIKYGKMKNLIWMIMEFMLIFIYGSRGPLVCYGIFLIIYILFENKKIRIKALFCMLIIGVTTNLERIVLIINEIAKRYNISSRTLYLLLNDFKHSSGRDVIKLKCIELITQHSIIGLGIAGEFKYMQDYPHNIVLDLCLNWGIIFGSLIFILLISIIGYALIKSKGKERFLMLVFTCYGFVVLFFSGTYLSWDGFYILIGIAIRIIYNKKMELKNG